MSNEYSGTWFSRFLDSIDHDQTAREVDFIARQLPLPDYQKVLDLCCGSGRHARLLAARGYRVTGVDNNMTALSAARRAGPLDVTYTEGDMRDPNVIPDATGAVVCLWQSFGYFDEATNERIVANITGGLPERGRLILDVYNREFFESRQGTQPASRGGDGIVQTRTMHGSRLVVELRYPDSDDTDRFEWRLYRPVELEQMAARNGLSTVLACADWDEEIAPSPNKGRMQLVFQKDER